MFNHTTEGNQLAPTLCFHGLDNPAYYRLAGDPRYYIDDTGCGNTVNAGDPLSLRLIMDSLRYWLTEMRSTASARPGAQPGPPGWRF